jgi:hypothetical protein
VPGLDEWIGSLFAEEHLDATCEALAAVSGLDPEDDEGRALDLRRQLKECDVKLSRYRALLEQDSDITVVANWIVVVERERKRLERELGRKPTSRRLTATEVKTLVRRLKDIVAAAAQGHRRGVGRRGSRGQESHLRRARREPHVSPRRTSPRWRRRRCTQGSCRRGDTTVSLTWRSPPSSPLLADAVGGSIGGMPAGRSTISRRCYPGETARRRPLG